jgi:O-antigen ligase
MPQSGAWGWPRSWWDDQLFVPRALGGCRCDVAVFVATSPAPARSIVNLGLLGVIGLPVLLTTPMGDKFIALLPFVGTVEQGTLTYRQRLFEVGVNVIMQNPFFGAYTFFLTEEAQELRQGSLIDLGNTYLAIGLGNGLVGLSLFVGFSLPLLSAYSLV